MEEDLEKIEKNVLNQIQRWLKDSPERTQKEIDNKISEKLRQENYSEEDWQIHYAIERIKKEVLYAENQSEQNINKPNKGMAVSSLIFGIIGGYPWASIASIVAIILGHISLIKIKKSPEKYSGKGLAIAGLILGYLGLATAITLGVMRGVLNAKLGL